MEDAGDKQWSKRLSWAKCREPYKTELDALGSQWIEGYISNEELAFEAVQLLSELDWLAQPDPTFPRVAFDDVVLNLKLLTEAMLGVSERPKSDQTPELRRQALDFMCQKYRSQNEPGR